MPQRGWTETADIRELGGLAETKWRIEALVTSEPT
jgi:hypothetical protein